MVVPYTKKISSCLAQALRIGNAGRFVDRRKMLAEDVNRVLAELQEKAFGHQKMALDSTLPPHVHHSRNHIGSKLCVAVEKQESVRLSVSPCFSQLLHNPESMGISRHIEMQDLTPVVADNEKAVQNTERERWDGEEVQRRNCLAMVSEERQPSLHGIWTYRGSPDPSRDTPFRDIETQLEQLTVNARCSPGRILGDHTEDQGANLFADTLPSYTSQVLSHVLGEVYVQ
jgi:hypothetical protein